MEHGADNWRVPDWNRADRVLISGKLPGRLEDCSDPVGALLYLGVRSRSRCLQWRLGRRSVGLGGCLRDLVKARREAVASFGGGITGWLRSPSGLHTNLTKQLALLAERHHRLSAPQKVRIPGGGFDAVRGPGWRKHLAEHARQLRKNGALLIVHGSQADGSTTAFSDIDMLMVGETANHQHMRHKSVIEDIVLQADPLQHHGLFFAEREDMSTYWQMELPMITLQRAVVPGEQAELDMRIIQEPYGAAVALLGSVRSWERTLAGQVRIRGLWDWKFRISQMLLIPSLLLAAGSAFVYKGDSFLLARGLYSDAAWEAVRALTHIREIWSGDYDREPYLRETGRRFGRLANDPVEVPPKLAIWPDDEFRGAATLFLRETLDLAGL